MDLRIYPIKTGYICLDKGLMVTPGADTGTKLLVPAICYLIVYGNLKILIDTGMPDTERAGWHFPGSRQKEEERIDRQLASLSTDPDDISSVIFTHLHWDHCSNLHFFKKASLYVQRRELAFALNPHPLNYKAYEAEAVGMTPPFANSKFTVWDGPFKLHGFIDIFPTPGHSIGHQSLSVGAGDDKWIICGDAIYNENTFNPKDHLPYQATGSGFDLWEQYDSIGTILNKAEGKKERLLYPHSEISLRREYYQINQRFLNPL
ncbi:MAG: N-acyl homoserine lactonase family protein [Desulfarculales bacterium]|nr:N-acyl homoserine lactonase family protein [Desulfarculales bacterium]